MNIRAIAIVLVVQRAWALQLVCPNSTSRELIFSEFQLDLDLGNASCSITQLLGMINSFEDAMMFENATVSDDSTALITGSLCGAHNNITDRRLQIRQSYTWSGISSKLQHIPRKHCMRNTTDTFAQFSLECRLCTVDNKDTRRLNDLNLTQEISDIMTAAQTDELIDKFISQPGSCLYHHWEAEVRVNITKSSTHRPQLPCG